MWVREHPDIETMPVWREQQLFVLATLFHATRGDGWTLEYNHKMHWMGDDSECLWGNKQPFCPKPTGILALQDPLSHCGWGVSCDNAKRVQKIQLYERNLMGFIPPEIALLSDSLVEFDIGKNHITGTLPTEIGLLHQLEVLDLSDSQYLYGKLGSYMGSLTSLIHLRLNGNYHLEGTVPTEIGCLSHLEVLNLNDVPLTGSLPSELGLLRKLRNLEIGTLMPLAPHTMSGTLPSELGLLSQLTMLRLTSKDSKYRKTTTRRLIREKQVIRIHAGNQSSSYYTWFSGPIPTSFGAMTSLEALVLNQNLLSGPLPTELGLLTAMTWLDLQANAFTGSIPSELALLSNLTSLYLGSNVLSGTLPTELFSIPSIESMSIRSCNITGTLPTEIGLLANLTGLFAETNRLTGPLPSEIGQLGRNVKSLSLYITNNTMKGHLPEELSMLTALRSLRLAGNQFTGTIPSSMARLSNLHDMHIQNTSISGAVPERMCELEFLNRLDLDCQGVSCQCPNSNVCHCWNDSGEIKNTTDTAKEPISDRVKQMAVDLMVDCATVPSCSP